MKNVRDLECSESKILQTTSKAQAIQNLYEHTGAPSFPLFLSSALKQVSVGT